MEQENSLHQVRTHAEWFSHSEHFDSCPTLEIEINSWWLLAFPLSSIFPHNICFISCMDVRCFPFLTAQSPITSKNCATTKETLTSH